MKESFTIEKIKSSRCAHLNQHLFAGEKKKKRSKFNANKKEVDGILFHSEREAKRYGELKLMRKAGLIGLLELQVPFELNEGGEFSYKYIADFCYRIMATGEKVVEDCKGYETKTFKKKEKLMKKIYGITIKKT